MGRPKKVISPRVVEKLAAIGASTKTIADKLGCSVDTIDGRFSGELAKGRATLQIAILKQQIVIMKRGSGQMAMFLGKQHCDQKDTPVAVIENNNFNLKYSKEDVKNEVERRKAENEKAKEAERQKINNGVKVGVN